MESTYDQQTSILLETVNRSKHAAPLKTGITLDPTTSTIIDPIIHRINAIEEKLNSSDAIYRLASQENIARDKERKQEIKNIVDFEQKLNERLDKIENTVNNLPQSIAGVVSEEVRNYDPSEKIKNRIEEINKKYAERYAKLEALLVESSKRNTKAIKKLNSQLQLVQSEPHDDAAIEEIQAQIDEMKRYQANIMSIMRTAMSQNAGELSLVSSQLNSVWEKAKH